jgi:hypothetical protein
MTNAKPRLALAFGILCISIFHWLKLLTLVNFSIYRMAIAVALVIALCANHQKISTTTKKSI